MRILKPLVAVLILLALATGIAVAAEKAARAHDIAVFSVPEMTKGGVLRDLAKALAGEPGIVKAKADRKGGTFKVTFDRQATEPARILKAVNTVSREATLVSVGPADLKAPGDKGCGGCPRAQSCP